MNKIHRKTMNKIIMQRNKQVFLIIIIICINNFQTNKQTTKYLQEKKT